MNRGYLAQQIASLPLYERIGNFFNLKWAEMNPEEGTGAGLHGIRNQSLLKTYKSALEASVKLLCNAPFNFKSNSDSVDVYILDISSFLWAPGPLTAIDFNNRPFIVLPARSNEPKLTTMRYRAIAETVHEVTHVFNCTKRPIDQAYSIPWIWFDEGLAIYMETKVLKRYPDYLRYMNGWCDYPQASLDNMKNPYPASMFLHYLIERFGIKSICKVWHESELNETPFEAIQRILSPETPIISDGFGEFDLFSSGYCMDAFFGFEEDKQKFAREVHKRYGQRLITESFKLKTVQTTKSEIYKIDHLGCRYFRFYLNDLKSVVVECNIITDRKVPMKAEIASVDNLGRKRDVIPLQPQNKLKTRRLTANLAHLGAGDIAFYILVVTNCGIHSNNEQKDEKEHDDEVPIQIEIKAME
jgi:hypothetical protein